MSFIDVLALLKKELILKYNKPKEALCVNNEMRRLELIKKIETLFGKVMKSIANNESPLFKTNYRSWMNCYYDDRLKLKDLKKIKRIKFCSLHSRSHFTQIILLLSEIHKLLITQQTSTRRELYYKNQHIFTSQKQVDYSMKDICSILDAPTWELNVYATSKGIVFGQVILQLKNGDYIDCNKKGGVSVPPNVLEIQKISSTATWVLIIEKDASFQRLIDGDLGSCLSSCILITGKGFPDVNTRMLICKFWEFLQVPILALVDANPHGFEIMCVYRFGSLNMSSCSGFLACPTVRWIGVHPSDIKPLLLESKNLSSRDTHKIQLLLKREYVESNQRLKNEVLLKENLKAEIESLASISTNYITDNYLKNKIHCNEYF